MRYSTDDVRIHSISELKSPASLQEQYPCLGRAERCVQWARKSIHDILKGDVDKLVVVVGPCSIHDPKSALEYAERIRAMREKYSHDLEIVMRVYFEKPRTTVGWKGLINDPDLDGSCDINKGLGIARKLIYDINMMEVPTGVEYLDMISPQYIADLVSWGAIGARTTESQVHRELASGLSCAVGFKNGTIGDVKVAVDAVGAANHPHSFLSVTKDGISAIVRTEGNEDCHVILRGGKKTNYDAESVAAAIELMQKAGLRANVMIDASHANSQKACRNQIPVVEDICRQIASGNLHIMGVMIESNLVEGRQDIVDGKAKVFGQSVTDACIGWEDTEQLLEKLASAVQRRRKVG